MDTSNNLNDFMGRLQNHGIRGQPIYGGLSLPSTDVGHYPVNNQTTPMDNDINTNNKSTSALLQLPAEIRELIWRNALSSPTGYIRPTRSGYRLHHYNQTLVGFHYQPVKNDALYSMNGSERIFLSLLSVSREIYHECAHMFWTTNIFVLDPLDSHQFSQHPDQIKENWISTSWYRKIKQVQLDVNICRMMRSFGDVSDIIDPLETALGMIEQMANPKKGSLKELTMRPISSRPNLDDLDVYLMIAGSSLGDYTKIMQVFIDFKKRGILEVMGVKQKAEIDILWNVHRKPENDTEYFERQPEGNCSLAMSVLAFLATHMGGINGVLWVDGRKCFELVDYEVKTLLDPFPVKEKTLEDKDEEAMGEAVEEAIKEAIEEAIEDAMELDS